MSCKVLAHLRELGIGRDLERQLAAARFCALLQFNCELAALGGEEGPICLAAGERQADHLGVVIDRLIKIRGFESRMTNPSYLDHGLLPYLVPTRSISADMPLWPPPSSTSASYSLMSSEAKSPNAVSRISRV